MPENKEEKEKKYSVDYIATQTEKSAIDNETQTPINMLDLVVEIANDVKEIKKNIVEQ